MLHGFHLSSIINLLSKLFILVWTCKIIIFQECQFFLACADQHDFIPVSALQMAVTLAFVVWSCKVLQSVEIGIRFHPGKILYTTPQWHLGAFGWKNGAALSENRIFAFWGKLISPGTIFSPSLLYSGTLSVVQESRLLFLSSRCAHPALLIAAVMVWSVSLVHVSGGRRQHSLPQGKIQMGYEGLYFHYLAQGSKYWSSRLAPFALVLAVILLPPFFWCNQSGEGRMSRVLAKGKASYYALGAEKVILQCSQACLRCTWECGGETALWEPPLLGHESSAWGGFASSFSGSVPAE